MTSEKALKLLPSLKAELAAFGKCGDDGADLDGSRVLAMSKDYNLLKFLRWKPNVQRAADRYRGLLQWRKENPFAFDSDPPLRASQDPNLKRVLESSVVVAPEGMVDKKGRPVIVGRLRNNDMSDGRTVFDVVRMGLYTIDRVLERETAQTNGVVVFHDMTGLSLNNLDPRIPKLLLGALVGHLPIRVHGIYFLNAPAFFKALFAGVGLLMIPAKLRSRMHFVKDIDEVYKVIDKDQMLEEHGGKRKHDAKEWVARQMAREADGSIESLGDCSVP